MKTIGLLGGMSWESSIEYYRILNETMRARLGGLHSAKCLLYSVDFAEVEPLQHQGRWDEAAELMIQAAQRLEHGGADLIVICTNTMHKLADEVQSHVGIPILHIADATAQAVKAKGFTTVGLLGTKFTMEEDFYRGRLCRKHGLRVLLPDSDERDMVHRVIFDELCMGTIRDSSRARYLEVCQRLADAGAQGIILGCTEIGLLIRQQDTTIPLFDTTQVHAEKAVDWALAP
jgi:aspartate racemase